MKETVLGCGKKTLLVLVHGLALIVSLRRGPFLSIDLTPYGRLALYIRSFRLKGRGERDLDGRADLADSVVGTGDGR